MAKEHELFRNFLGEKQLKLTPQRRAILDIVFETHRHFDAEELVEIIRQRQKRISRATVYRTLDLLVRAGLVAAMELGETRKVYEHVTGHKHHDHMICTKCGRAIEFDDGFIELLQQKVCERLNFEAETHSLRIFGRCEKCRLDFS
ncbi:MAG: transcriptional repressor [Candidatus Lindowbacteria bacterium]|nr:transcriptional repressor [Candidatus Lindowbacteria bacterium]